MCVCVCGGGGDICIVISEDTCHAPGAKSYMSEDPNTRKVKKKATNYYDKTQNGNFPGKPLFNDS